MVPYTNVRFWGGLNMKQYKYNGHVVDVYCTLAGYVAHLDNDLEPIDISEEEYINIVNNGKQI